MNGQNLDPNGAVLNYRNKHTVMCCYILEILNRKSFGKERDKGLVMSHECGWGPLGDKRLSGKK